MSFTTGQKVCLWQEQVEKGLVRVLKEVIVTITEIKTGVLGEFSNNPSTSQSLKGIGDDGLEYEKHWDSWPESQTSTFTDQWSMRDDGNGIGGERFWIPKESVSAHNGLTRHNKKYAEHSGVVKRVDMQGNPILPKGDITICETHARYSHVGVRCFDCVVAERMAVKEPA